MKSAFPLVSGSTRLTPRVALLAVAVIGITALSPGAHADTWTGGSLVGSNWTDPANWGGTAPLPGDALIFDGAARLTPSNDFAAITQFNGIAFNPTALAFALGGNSLNLQGDIVNNSTTTQALTLGVVLTQSDNFNAAAGAFNISSSVSGLAGNITINLNGSAAAVSTLSGTIANGGATAVNISVSGTATWALTGFNSFTGNVSVLGGTLRASDFTGLPNTALLTLNGGVFETDNFSRALGATGGTFQIPGGVSGFSGNGFSASVGNGATLLWGDPNFNPGTLVLQAPTANQPLSFAYALDLNGAIRAITVNNNSTANSASINANISDSSAGGGITKLGTGILALTGFDTYAGNTTISGGTLRALDGSSLPTASLLILNGGVFETSGGFFARALGTLPGQVQIPSGASGFSANGSPLTVNVGGASAVLLWGDPNFNPGTLTLQAASADQALTLGNGLDLNGAVRTIAVNSTAVTASATIGAALIDSGAGGGLIKSGAGYLILAAPSAYTGPTTVNGGILRADDGIGVPISSALTLNGGTLETQLNFTRTLGSGPGQVQIPGGTGGFSANGAAPVTINLNSNATLQWGSAFFNPGTLILQDAAANTPLTFANGLDLAGGARAVNVAANVATIAGAIVDSATGGTFTKSGSGTLVLNQANTYPGNTTLTGGGLQLGDGISNGTLAGNIILTGGTLIVLPIGSVTVPGNISGTGNVNIPFITPTASTVTLAGANTYTGNLIVSNGTFVLNSSTNTGAGTGTLIVNASSPTGQAVTLLTTGVPVTISKIFQVGGALANPHGATFAGNRNITFNSTSSSFTATAAHVYINNNLGGGAQLTFAGPFNMSNSASNRSVHFTGSGTTIISGPIFDSITTPTSTNSVLIRDNSTVSSVTGVTILNSTSLGYHGGTQVNAGTLLFNVAGTLPPTTIQGNAVLNAYIRVRNGGAVGYAGGITDPGFLARLANDNQVNATTNSFGTGSIAIMSNADATQNIDFASAPASGPSYSTMALGAAMGAFTYSGTLTPLAPNWKLGGGDGTLTLTQTLTDLNSAPANLQVLGGGGGVLILAGTGATYTGATTLNNFQTLKNGVDNALSPATTLAVGATTSNTTSVYDLNGFNQTLSGFSGAGVITSSAGPSTLFFDVSGTANTFTGSYSGNVGLGLEGSGTFNFSNASTMVGPSIVAGGVTFFINNGAGSAGTITGAGNVEVAATTNLTCSAVSVASLLIDASAAVSIRPSSPTSGVSTLTLAGAPGAWISKLDLNNNSMIVANGGNVPNQIFQAANLGAWNGGGGITSSSAQAAATTSTATALGYATGAEFTAATGQTTFSGQSFNPTDTLIKYTLAGDANLDGSVTFADFLALQNNYNKPGDWSQGDWNYDGQVTFADFLILQNNYNKSLPAGPIVPATTPNSAPEPASLLLLALAWPVVVARRRTPRAR